MNSNSNDNDPYDIIVLSENFVGDSSDSEDTIVTDSESLVTFDFSSNMNESGYWNDETFNISLTDLLDPPNDMTISRGNGREIKVAETLERIDDKLDAIITRVEMVEQALCENLEIKQKLDGLPSLEDLIHQKQMIDTIRQSGDD
jgi:hypothetical protein